jgi:hypothetical protein
MCLLANWSLHEKLLVCCCSLLGLSVSVVALLAWWLVLVCLQCGWVLVFSVFSQLPIESRCGLSPEACLKTTFLPQYFYIPFSIQSEISILVTFTPRGNLFYIDVSGRISKMYFEMYGLW